MDSKIGSRLTAGLKTSFVNSDKFWEHWQDKATVVIRLGEKATVALEVRVVKETVVSEVKVASTEEKETVVSEVKVDSAVERATVGSEVKVDSEVVKETAGSEVKVASMAVKVTAVLEVKAGSMAEKETAVLVVDLVETAVLATVDLVVVDLKAKSLNLLKKMFYNNELCLKLFTCIFHNHSV